MLQFFLLNLCIGFVGLSGYGSPVLLFKEDSTVFSTLNGVALQLHPQKRFVTLIYIDLHNLTKGGKKMENKDRNAWQFGFTAGAENWNGRLAMIGFAAAVIIELVSGQGVLHFWGLM